MGLIDDQQAAVLARQLAAALHEARIGEDHADVGHRRLAEQGADITLGQGGLQCCDIVEGDGAAVLGQVVGLADQPRAVHRLAVPVAHHHVIDGAVVAAIEHQQGLALGDGARPAQHVAVGVGRRGGDLPVGQAEALRQQFAADHGILAGEHGGQAVAGLLGDGAGHGIGRVTEHAAGVAQAEVDVLMTVHVEEACALGALDEQRHRCRPVGHPVHRHAAVQRMACTFGQGCGFRVAGQEQLALGSDETLHGGLADTTGGGHGKYLDGVSRIIFCDHKIVNGRI